MPADVPRRSSAAAPGEEPLVTVVLVVHDDGPRLRSVVDAVQAQTYAGWELVVVDDGSADDTAAVLAGVAAFEPRVVPVTVPRGGVARARNAALDKARGTYVAFADADHPWDPDFLRVMLGHLGSEDRPMAHAAMRVKGSDGEWYRAVDGGRDHLLAHDHVDLAAVVVRRDLVAEVGGFDETLGGAETLDLLLRLSAQAPLHLVPRVLLDRAPDAIDDEPRWTATVLERHLVDWAEAQHRPREARRVSIVLHTTADLDRTVRWVTRTMSRRRENADVELVVVGSRLPRAVELPLAMLLATYPNARLLAMLPRLGPAVCANLGIAATTGEIVVLARTTANPPRDAFHALSAALADHTVAIAQPLVVDRPGLVVSAGAVFGPGRPHPEPFLAGHPVRDAQELTTREVPAPLSPVVAVRGSELVRLRGLDVGMGDALPEVELGLRMIAHDAGATVVVPSSPLVLKAGQLPRLDTASEGVRALQERWPTAPYGSEAAWARAGFEVVGRRWEDRAVPPGTERDPLDTPALTPAHGRAAGPRRRTRRGAVAALGPRHRRTLRTSRATLGGHLLRPVRGGGARAARSARHHRHPRPAPPRHPRPRRRRARAARPRPRHTATRPGQPAVGDQPPRPGDRRGDVGAFDRVYAASATWAARASAATGVAVTPLLQCTDPRLFNPDRGEPDTGPPVLFVGNSRDVYRRSVRSALAVGAEVEVHGADWERFLAPNLIASKIIANDDLGALYCSAGVVLNDHHDDMRRDGFLGNRLFDVTACAARLVTDEIEGLSEVFGDVVKTFNDETEMGPLLADPVSAFPSREARLAVAETVMREHSFDHRAEVLLDDAVRLLAR